MKLKWVMCVFLVLVASAMRLPAQQSDADRKLFEDTKAQAEKGDANAQGALGEIYGLGLYGVAKDEVEAVKWHRKAAEQNEPEAQCNLGGCYYRGGGVAKDEVEAEKWFRKAAEQNYAKAQFNLGVYYARGEGVEEEWQRMRWKLRNGFAKPQSRITPRLNSISVYITLGAKAWRRTRSKR